jgi:TPR repeat protein
MHDRGILPVQTRPLGIGPMIAALGLVLLSGAPARAQFYDLDGAYHCLTAPDAACKKSENPPPPLPPPPPATSTVEEVIEHIRAQKVTPADIEAIKQRAAAKEPRAVEVLAWCELNGIGTKADPIEAYVLYGEAARLGVPTAKSNQAAVYETRLNQEQRQLALMREQSR